VEFGAHLPQIAWGDGSPSFGALADYVRLANAIGMRWLTANDHFVFGRPWLDGHVALSSVLEASGSMTVATSIALPVVRGPAPLAKTLAAIDRLSGGRLVVGVGPGSSEHDYRAAGIPWEDRWQRFEEAVQALRALLRPGGAPFEGRFYSTVGMDLLPPAAQAGGPPIWVGSWGSDTALRRVARLGDGWLASGYNATPEGFSDAVPGWANTCGPAASTPNASRTRSPRCSCTSQRTWRRPTTSSRRCWRPRCAETPNSSASACSSARPAPAPTSSSGMRPPAPNASCCGPSGTRSVSSSGSTTRC
jgi:alkanesulfonate monooxygenase SsuD/methylene tetrahydromethanopterin reductase-like flavin-dependent oxidoreductase (luciferase family)